MPRHRELHCPAVVHRTARTGLRLTRGQRRRLAGMLVYVRVDPRRNQLLMMSPAGAVTDR
jgi:hypothetical protein